MNIEMTGSLPVAEDLTETLKKISVEMQSSAAINFDQSGRPTKWTPLKYRDGKPLIYSGALVMSLTPSSGMDFAQVSEGRGLVYAAIHQFGGTTHPVVTEKMRSFYWAKWFETQDEKWKWMAIGAKIGSTLTIKIPARPSLVWLDEDVERYKTMLLSKMVSFEDVEVAKRKRMAA